MELVDIRPLCELAWEVHSADETGSLLSQALECVGDKFPSKRQAGKNIVRAIEKLIVLGKCSPYDGARSIWGVYNIVPELPEALPYIGFASEWEDGVEKRRVNEALILLEASSATSEADLI